MRAQIGNTEWTKEDNKMKILVSILLDLLLVIYFVTVGGCSQKKYICLGKDNKTQCYTFKPYGLFNTEERNPNVKYEVSIGNVIWSVLLSESIAVPLVLIGWYLYEPVGKKMDHNIPGVVEE